MDVGLVSFVVAAIAQLPGYFLTAWLVEVWGRRETLSVFLAVSSVAVFAFSQAGCVAALCLPERTGKELED